LLSGVRDQMLVLALDIEPKRALAAKRSTECSEQLPRRFSLPEEAEQSHSDAADVISAMLAR